MMSMEAARVMIPFAELNQSKPSVIIPLNMSVYTRIIGVLEKKGDYFLEFFSCIS